MYSSSTTHYNLPQYEANDVPSILGDLNGAYNTIDSAIYAAADEASDASSVATEAKTTAETALANVAGAQADATQALADAATADGKAVAAQTDATQALGDASDAMTAATNAQTDATNALTAATNAQTTASSALSAASDATTAAGNAATAAATAQNTANTAVANAATADGKAVAAQSDATQALSDAASAGTKAGQALDAITDVKEEGDTATSAHAIGDLFFDKNGALVKTTSAIAIGDTIAVGTNVAETSVAEELGNTSTGGLTLVHTAAKGQTYSAQFAELLPYYTALSADEKLKVEVYETSDDYATHTPFNNVTLGASTLAVGRMSSSSSGLTYTEFGITATPYAFNKLINASGGNITTTDILNDNHATAVSLYIRN